MIGFVVPMEKEARALVKALKKKRSFTLKGRKFHVGVIGAQECVILISGTAKVPSASGTQLLLDHYECKLVYHFGSAGGLAANLKIGDLVVASEIVEHDCVLLFGTDIKLPRAMCDVKAARQLVKFAKSVGANVHYGRMLSGNEDVISTPRRDQLLQLHEGMSVDWESAGCALVCNLNDVPVVVVRTISDYAYENTHNEYSENAEKMCANLSGLLVDMLSSGGSRKRGK